MTRSTTPTTLALFGATGGIGRALIRQALDRGHAVRALARDPSALADVDDADGRLTVLAGDVTDPDAVARALAGADAVLCALGAPALSRSRVRSEGTRTIVTAMRDRGLDRVVAVSVYGAHETRAHLTPFLRWVLFPLYLRRAVADHERQEQVLAESGLRWTALRPPHLTDGPLTGRYAAGFDRPDDITWHVSRADVAHFALDVVDHDRYVGATPAISDVCAA